MDHLLSGSIQNESNVSVQQNVKYEINLKEIGFLLGFFFCYYKSEQNFQWLFYEFNDEWL